MSVAMTNCGAAGWITDRRSYRYTADDPESGKPWPAMPQLFLKLADEAADAAGFRGFVPDACLINRYEPGTRLSPHQDRDEADYKPSHRVGVARIACHLPVRWAEARRSHEESGARPRRCRGLGRTVTPRPSRRADIEKRRASVDRTSPLQSHLEEGSVVTPALRFCSLISVTQRFSSLSRYHSLNSAGVELLISTPCFLKRSITSGSAATLAMAACSLSTDRLGRAGRHHHALPEHRLEVLQVASTSATVGMSGKAGERLGLEMAIARVLPDCEERLGLERGREHHLRLARPPRPGRPARRRDRARGVVGARPAP